jgi:starch phosphorylase
MKMALNGAVTIGTLDGANVEIRERVGESNFFLFGHTTEQVVELDRLGYHPMSWIEQDPIARDVLSLIGSGHFSDGDRDLYHPLLASLTSHDPFRVMADVADYRRAQNAVDEAWLDRGRWARMSLHNTMRCGFFSSDRSIRDYAERIWKVPPVRVQTSAGAPAP